MITADLEYAVEGQYPVEGYPYHVKLKGSISDWCIDNLGYEPSFMLNLEEQPYRMIAFFRSAEDLVLFRIFHGNTKSRVNLVGFDGD